MTRATPPALLIGFCSATALFFGLWTAGVGTNDTFLFAGIFCLLLLYVILAGRLLGGVLFRVLLALLPLLAGAALLIWTVILASERIEATAKPALFAGSLIATGWLATFLANEYQRERERLDRQRDTLIALRSEIFTIVDKLDNQDIDERASEVQTRIKDAPIETPYFPFASSESPVLVFEAVSGSISLLDTATLEPVLRLYAAFSDLTALVEDTRSTEFQELSPSRRISMHKELTLRRKASLLWGVRAYVAINKSPGLKRPERIRRSGLNEEIA
ncbi:MAG: hypothetical protein AAF636_01695 [Pseudomonadota bacterium]